MDGESEFVEIVTAGNIHQLLNEFKTATGIKIIKISGSGEEYCDVENYKYQDRKNIFDNTFSLYYLLVKNYWSTSYKHWEIGNLNLNMQLYKLKLNEVRKTNAEKMASMNRIRVNIEHQIGKNADWYWWPDWSLVNVTKTIEIETLALTG